MSDKARGVDMQINLNDILEILCQPSQVSKNRSLPYVFSTTSQLAHHVLLRTHHHQEAPHCAYTDQAAISAVDANTTEKPAATISIQGGHHE